MCVKCTNLNSNFEFRIWRPSTHTYIGKCIQTCHLYFCSNISAGIVGVMNEHSLKIKSMKFKQVNFVKTTDLFLHVMASEGIVFEDCDFKFHKTLAINVIYAKEVKFDKCKLDLLDETSVKISAEYVEFINTKLETPLPHSLNEMIGTSENSILKMINITLINPTQSIFVVNFAHLILKNISVSGIKCKTMCETLKLKNLACTDDFEISHDRTWKPYYVPCEDITVRIIFFKIFVCCENFVVT